MAENGRNGGLPLIIGQDLDALTVAIGLPAGVCPNGSKWSSHTLGVVNGKVRQEYFIMINFLEDYTIKYVRFFGM